MDRRFNVNQWQIEENRADAVGHVWWSQTKSFADGPQLEQRSQFRLQTGALQSRAAAFPQNRTASTLYPDQVGTGIPTSGAVARTGEVQQNFNTKAYVHYAATRTYTTVDGKTHVVQRYQVNGTVSNGAYEEYRYDALGRRVLMRTRKTTTPPPGGGTLAALCTIGPYASAISRWVWDGAQLLGETRAPGQDGLSAGALDQLFGSPPHYGVVGYVHHHAGGWDEPKALMDGDDLAAELDAYPARRRLDQGAVGRARLLGFQYRHHDLLLDANLPQHAVTRMRLPVFAIRNEADQRVIAPHEIDGYVVHDAGRECRGSTNRHTRRCSFHLPEPLERLSGRAPRSEPNDVYVMRLRARVFDADGMTPRRNLRRDVELILVERDSHVGRWLTRGSHAASDGEGERHAFCKVRHMVAQ